MSEIRRRNWTQLSEDEKNHINNIIIKAQELESLIKGSYFKLSHEQLNSIDKLRECVMWAVNGLTKPEVKSDSPDEIELNYD